MPDYRHGEEMPDKAENNAQAWITLQVLARFDKDLGRWIAGSPDLEVWSSGATPQESVARANEAILLFLNEATEIGTVWGILERAGIRLQQEPAPFHQSWFGRLKTFSYEAFVPAVFPVRAPAAA